MRDLLRRGDIFKVLQDYRTGLSKEYSSHPNDLSLKHRLDTITDIEHRIRILARGGLTLIKGGID